MKFSSYYNYKINYNMMKSRIAEFRNKDLKLPKFYLLFMNGKRTTIFFLSQIGRVNVILHTTGRMRFSQDKQ